MTRTSRTAALAVSVLASVAAVSTMVVRHQNTKPVATAVEADAAATRLAVSDDAIVQALRDESLPIANLSVRSFNGIVILRGNADAATAGRAVAAVQRLGLDRVANLITPAAPSRDEEIRREAERELANAGSLRGSRLSVKCEEGILSVSGTVQNEYQRDTARSVVRGIRGAREVRINLAIVTASASM